MPLAARKPCPYPGCSALLQRGERHCAQHGRKVEQARGSASARGYDRAWQGLRKAFLSAHPLCQCDDCDDGRKRVTAATVVDHRIPIRERPDLRLEWSNLRSMSKGCHDRHTALTQGFAQPRGPG